MSERPLSRNEFRERMAIDGDEITSVSVLVHLVDPEHPQASFSAYARVHTRHSGPVEIDVPVTPIEGATRQQIRGQLHAALDAALNRTRIR